MNKRHPAGLAMKQFFVLKKLSLFFIGNALKILSKDLWLWGVVVDGFIFSI